MNLARYFDRRLLLCLALVLSVSATADAQKKKKKKKNAGQTQPQQTQPQQTQPQQTQPQQTQPAPSANSKQVDQTLRKVDRKLHAYATSAARTELGGLAQDESAGPLTALGRIYEQEKDYAEALRCLKKAGELDPGDPAPWAHLGEAYLHQKRQNEATAAFREAEKRATAAVNASAADKAAHYYLGVARLRLGKYAPAAASLEKARQLDPNDALPIYQLGLTKALEGKWQESVDLFTKALEANAGLAYAYFYRAQSASKLKRKDILIADLQRFLELAPNAPEAPIARRTIASARR